MNRLSLTAALFFISICCYANESGGITSALSWLEMLDSGAYSESWEGTAPFFQRQVTKKQWENALQSARAPFGKLVSREINESNAHTSLPGVPDGEYMIITLTTTFEHKQSATETVIVSKEGNEWLVITYFIY